MIKLPDVSSLRTNQLDRALRVIGFVLWFSFILFCVGLNQSHGLCCADDAFFSNVAKSLASGLGYATTLPFHEEEITHPILFDPYSTTGPTLILPCAIALKIFGKNEVLPGLTAILIWGGVLTLVLARISRRIDGLSFLLGVTVMCSAFLGTLALHFEHWYAFLGEVVTVAFLILAHWLISNERFSAISSLLCGLALGCAFQTKFLAVIPAMGIVPVFIVRGMRGGFRPVQLVKYAAALLIGFLVPTLTFEAYKLFELGGHGYLANWQELFHIIRTFGMRSNVQLGGHGTVTNWQELLYIIRQQFVGSNIHGNLLLVQQRLALVHDHFSVNLIGLLGLITLGVFLYWRSTSKNWILLSAGLLLSVAATAIYWATLSIGWPRYLVIAVAMGAFLLSVPIFTLELWPKLLFALSTMLLLSPGLARAGNLVQSADHGLFRPTPERVARASLVRIINQRQQQGPTILAARYWPSFAAVEFSLPGIMNFKRIETVIDLPGPKLILLNHTFDPFAPPQDEIIKQVRTRTSSIIFSGGPYELLEVR